MKRKVKIFKWTVPMWALVLSLLIVTAAAAAFIAQLFGTVSATTGSFGPVTLLSDATASAVDPSGAGVTCSVTGTGGGPSWAVDMSSLYPGAGCQINLNIQNEGQLPATVAGLSGDYGAEFDVSTDYIGQVIPENFGGGVAGSITVLLTDVADPGASYGPVSVNLDFEP